MPFVVLDHQLAVEQRGIGRQRCDRGRDRLEAMRPIQALAGQQAHLAVIEPRLDAIAVELDLVQPFGAARRGRRAGSQGSAARSRAARVAICAPRAALLSARPPLPRPRALARAAPTFAASFGLRDARRSLPVCAAVFRLGAAAIAVPDPLLAFARGNLVDRAAGHDRQRLLLKDVLAARRRAPPRPCP